MTPHLRLAVTEGVARIAIDRPAKRNAFDQAMWARFPDLVEEALAAPGIRLLVVAAAMPGPFSAGADIGEFAAHAADPEWRRVNGAAIRRTQTVLARAPIPTVALIEGDCIGGGCGIALACDLRIASPAARFGITPARLGLVYPLHDTRLLVDLVGPAQARRLLYTATIIDAAEALRIGLVEQMVSEPADALADFTAAILATAPSTQRHSKAIVRRILDGALDDDSESAALFDAAFAGPDFQEGVTAFMAKRPPVFAAP